MQGSQTPPVLFAPALGPSRVHHYYSADWLRVTRAGGGAIGDRKRCSKLRPVTRSGYLHTINPFIRRLVNPNQNRGLTEMSRQVAAVLYAVAMAAAIVGVDFVFFRNRFWERLIVNVGIVLVFAAFYLRFLGRP